MKYLKYSLDFKDFCARPTLSKWQVNNHIFFAKVTCLHVTKKASVRFRGSACQIVKQHLELRQMSESGTTGAVLEAASNIFSLFDDRIAAPPPRLDKPKLLHENKPNKHQHVNITHGAHMLIASMMASHSFSLWTLTMDCINSKKSVQSALTLHSF